ncbi:hypothetical protein ABEV34_04765 [Methylorubrum rhodesianum]|uniref:hypothetical protein n=1 Tax=Methylorubrum rhodesianum TaxID=29427 RepID=UPI003D272AE8
MTDFRTLNGRTLEQAASDLVQREVLCCMSSMVSTLASGFAGDGSGSDLQNLSEQAAELAAPVLDYEGAAREAGFEERDLDGTPHWCHRDTPADNPYSCFYETAADVCDMAPAEPHEHEVFEHWAVSQWLGDMLQAKGERVDDDFAGLVVWARTTTGQAISMDAVIQEITRELHLGNAA